MEISLVLFHGQLQLANWLIYLDFENTVHRFLLVKTILKLYGFVASVYDEFFCDFDCFNQVIDVIVYDFAPDKVADVEDSRNLLAIPFLENTCDFLSPDFDDILDDVGHGQLAWL